MILPNVMAVTALQMLWSAAPCCHASAAWNSHWNGSEDIPRLTYTHAELGQLIGAVSRDGHTIDAAI